MKAGTKGCHECDGTGIHGWQALGRHDACEAFDSDEEARAFAFQAVQSHAPLLDKRDELLARLAWIVSFIDEHQEWWGDINVDCAENEWLSAAREDIK